MPLLLFSITRGGCDSGQAGAQLSVDGHPIYRWKGWKTSVFLLVQTKGNGGKAHISLLFASSSEPQGSGTADSEIPAGDGNGDSSEVLRSSSLNIPLVVVSRSCAVRVLSPQVAGLT